MTAAGFPHSDTPGSQLGCQLPRAYRRLQRPSSALDAKASTMCPLQLAKHKHSTKTTKTHTTKTNTHTHHTPPPDNPHTREKPGWGHSDAGDARVHYPEIKQPEATSPTRTPPGPRVLMSQNPNSVLETRPPTRTPRSTHPTDKQQGCSTSRTRTRRPDVRRRLHYPNTTNNPAEHSPAAASHKPGGCVLLRKEVIQPHLPVRLPCYDFVPIASPTFDHSLPLRG
jgi:hypothetical protein